MYKQSKTSNGSMFLILKNIPYVLLLLLLLLSDCPTTAVGYPSPMFPLLTILCHLHLFTSHVFLDFVSPSTLWSSSHSSFVPLRPFCCFPNPVVDVHSGNTSCPLAFRLLRFPDYIFHPCLNSYSFIHDPIVHCDSKYCSFQAALGYG